ncbi:MAG: molybdopterin biosynthesis protein [Desulfovibrio sp.]|nr:molybdopterin biosynthesis protein [Desulfovibrio sp.]
MERNVYLTLQSPEEARQLWFTRISERVQEPGSESVPLEKAAHRVLSQPAEALRSSPAFHGAAMDGIAVRAESTFSASPRTPLSLEIGREAFWINTGQPLPKGCDAVIMVEDVRVAEDGKTVITEKAAFPWQHVRKLGEDIVATEILLAPGVEIGAYELGALAAAGVLTPSVFRKAKVAVIPTGSEIVPLAQASEEDLALGKVLPEFNSLVLSTLISDAGGETDLRPITPDDPKALVEAISRAALDGADVVLLIAGSSAGSRDFSAEAIQRLGEVLVHGVAVMPGKPAMLGLVSVEGRTLPVMGAPGYPVSAIIAVEEFLLPLLAFWQKRRPKTRERIDVVPCTPLPSRPGMEERIRVRLGMVDETCFAVPLPRGAGTVTSLSRADAIIPVARDCEGLDANVPVRAELLRSRSQIAGSLLIIGSHDNTLELIDSLLRQVEPRFSLTSAHVGSLGGLLALKRGQCHLAGSHLLDEASGVYNRAAIREHLKGVPVMLVHLAQREQGFVVMPGNPKGIKDVSDLVRDDVTFINRQRGSGTRVLLDYELQRKGIAFGKIRGYRDEEYTHMNVAAAVLSGRADTGLGVRAAACALHLDFVPLGPEEYDLVIPLRFAEDERIQTLLEVIRSQVFRDKVTAMGGYDVSASGEILWTYDGKEA